MTKWNLKPRKFQHRIRRQPTQVGIAQTAVISAHDVPMANAGGKPDSPGLIQPSLPQFDHEKVVPLSIDAAVPFVAKIDTSGADQCLQ